MGKSSSLKLFLSKTNDMFKQILYIRFTLLHRFILNHLKYEI